MMAPKKAAFREIIALENEALTRTVGSPETKRPLPPSWKSAARTSPRLGCALRNRVRVREEAQH